MNNISKFIILSVFLSTVFGISVNAEPVLSTDIVKTNSGVTKNSYFKFTLSEVDNKYENLNIKAAYDDLNKLINKFDGNDFYLLVVGNKAAELGFFDISKAAYSKIKDIDISSKNIEEYKKFYYPKNNINKADILILAELYSNIMYNDRIQETISELTQYPRFLKESDYANYIMALGYFKLNDFENANAYVLEAIKQNPTNLNYKLLAAQIFSGTKKDKYAKKYLKEVKKHNIELYSLVNKIAITEEYMKYLSAKKKFDKDYYLGCYYFSEKDYVKASKVLISAVGKNKKNNALNYSLLARCFFEQGDYSKTNEYITKTLKITKTNPDCLIAIGDVKMKDGDLKAAYKAFKGATSSAKTRQIALERLASVGTKLYGTKRGKDYYESLLKEYKNSYVAYYKVGLISRNHEANYFKKSVSLNIFYQDAWIDLARIMIENGNFELAKNYLSVANYLDDKNFRYYYYQSLLKKKEAGLNHAAYKKQYFDS